METILSPPQPFRFDENLFDVTSGRLSDSWTRWKKGFKIYFEACELNKKAEQIQMNIFLHIVGEQCCDIVEQFKETTLDGVLKKLDCHFETKRNLTVERHKFFMRNQQEDETIDQYIFDLRKLAMTCEFGDLNDDLIKDRLVCGIISSAIRERLLREENLSLNKAIEIYQAAIVSKMYSENIMRESKVIHNVVENENQNSNHGIYEIKNRREPQASSPLKVRGNIQNTRRKSNEQERQSNNQLNSQRRVNNSIQPRNRKSTECSKCGIKHEYAACPAYGKTCFRCLKLNHFAKKCHAYLVEALDQEVNLSLNKNFVHWTVELKINGCNINFKLDTGAEVNVLPLSYLYKIGVSYDQLISTNTKLSGYSGAVIKVVGKIFLKVFYKNDLFLLEFIADVNSIPVLSCDACVELNLIRKVCSVQSHDILPDFLNDFKDVFCGIGCLQGEYDIQLKSDAIPTIHAPRKLPFAIKEDVKKKLLEMESQGIIAKVEGPSDWVSSITVVKKPNGDLRICLDPKELNQAIKREHFKLPTIDEIVSKLAGAKFFSTLDVTSGFWNVKLGDSSKYCTFNTPFGRYKFLRMPFGICSASEVFHKKIYENFDDIEGVCMYIDDILVFAPNKDLHDEI